MGDLSSSTNPPDDHVTLIEEIDQIMEHWSDEQQEFAEKEEKLQAERSHFLADYETLADSVIKPTMHAIVGRLEQDGGGGSVWEGTVGDKHPGRLILWMSLRGKLTETPRQDRNPYLQLDLNPGGRRVDVWEGDMWEGRGTSRDSTPWQLSEITADAVTQRVLGILERATEHGGEFDPPVPFG